jgi:hypothetical protein
MADVEKLAQERRRILLASVLSYGLWCGAFVLEQTPWVGVNTRHLLSVLVLVFGLPWMLCCLWLVSWLRRAKAKPQVMGALNDEMTVRNRWRAQRASAFTLLICLMVGVAITSYVEVSGRIVLLMLIWVLVVSQIGFYLWFDRSE